MVRALDVKEDLCTNCTHPRIAEIKTEGQLRELVEVPTEDLPKVFSKVVEASGENRITAAIIRQVVQGINGNGKPETKPRSSAPAKAATEQPKPVSGTLLDPELDEEKEEPKQKAVDKPATMTKAEQAIFNASVLKEIVKSLQQAKRLAKAVEQIPGMEMFLARQLSIEREIESAKQAVNVTIPHSVCIRCKGKGCPHCGNHGWVNSVMAEQLEHGK